MADVSVKNISKAFGSSKALDDVTVNFPDGGFFALLGPSGSGKTTLLRAIAGFIFVDSGSIYIGDESVENMPVEKRGIGMMFQNYALFPNMSVADNIGFGLRVRKVGVAEERRRIADALDLVQLGQFAERKPHQLSGGQQQRVALARAIVTNPRVLLLDEPLSALDKSLRVEMQFELKRIQREIGITTIFVTHDQEEALTLSDRIGILRDGVLIQEGDPREVYNHPSDMFTAAFLGDANILSNISGAGVDIKIPKKSPSGTILAVRPENITISKTEPKADAISKLSATLERRVFAGAIATCIFRCNGNSIKVVARDQDIPTDITEGERLWLSWPAEKTLSVSPS